MYADTTCYLSAAHRDALTAFETEIDRPIRVLYGSARPFAGRRWAAVHRGDYSAEIAREKGITVVVWSTLHTLRFDSVDFRPGDGLFTERNDGRNHTAYDCLLMPDSTDDWQAEPLLTGPRDLAVGEIGERVVTLSYNWTGYEDFNLDVLKAGVYRSMDENFLTDLKSRMSALTMERFAKYAQRASNEGLDRLRGEVGGLMTRYDQAVAAAASHRVELRQKQALLDSLLDVDGSSSQQAMLDTWAKLLDDDRIENVTFDSSECLVIDTVGLNITNPVTNQEAYLGKMRWRISISTSMCEVTNLDNARGGYDHPHVYMNRPCFGELGATIYTMIKQGNLYPAVEMIFAFLKSINQNDDWGRRAAFWFEDAEDSPRNAALADATDLVDVDEIVLM